MHTKTQVGKMHKLLHYSSSSEGSKKCHIYRHRKEITVGGAPWCSGYEDMASTVTCLSPSKVIRRHGSPSRFWQHVPTTPINGYNILYVLWQWSYWILQMKWEICCSGNLYCLELCLTVQNITKEGVLDLHNATFPPTKPTNLVGKDTTNILLLSGTFKYTVYSKH